MQRSQRLLWAGAVIVLIAGQRLPAAAAATGSFGVRRSLPAGQSAHFPGIDRQHNRLYVSNVQASTVTAIDLASGAIAATIPVGKLPHTVLVDNRTGRVYVTEMGENAVAVIDSASNTVLTTIPVGKKPHGLALDAAAGTLYVTNIDDNSISVVDLRTSTVTSTVGVGAGPWGVAVDPATQEVFVANTAGHTLSVIDAHSGQLASTIDVGEGPWNVTVNEADHSVYVGDERSNDVAVVRDGRLVTRIPVGMSPHGIGVSGGSVLYVANTGSSSVSVIDLASNQVVQTVAVPAMPAGLALDGQTGDAYVASQGAAMVSLIGPLGVAAARTMPAAGSGPPASQLTALIVAAGTLLLAGVLMLFVQRRGGAPGDR